MFLCNESNWHEPPQLCVSTQALPVFNDTNPTATAFTIIKPTIIIREFGGKSSPHRCFAVITTSCSKHPCKEITIDLPWLKAKLYLYDVFFSNTLFFSSRHFKDRSVHLQINGRFASSGNVHSLLSAQLSCLLRRSHEQKVVLLDYLNWVEISEKETGPLSFSTVLVFAIKFH